MKKHYKRVLTIAGSDPSGGAGIQADLKTFSACGCYGMSAIVAVVDENTVGVTGVHPVPVDFVTGQIRSVLDDIGADAVKIGMLHSSELIRAVRETLAAYDIRNIVLDPVMVATSGDRLLQEEAIATLQEELVPFVRVITPNIPEAEILLGRKIAGQEELPQVARELSFGRKVSVLLKAAFHTLPLIYPWIKKTFRVGFHLDAMLRANLRTSIAATALRFLLIRNRHILYASVTLLFHYLHILQLHFHRGGQEIEKRPILARPPVLQATRQKQS